MPSPAMMHGMWLSPKLPTCRSRRWTIVYRERAALPVDSYCRDNLTNCYWVLTRPPANARDDQLRGRFSARSGKPRKQLFQANTA
jgi:hypothetical protein